jgi:hypothetical protein
MKIALAKIILVVSGALLMATTVLAVDKFNDGWDDLKASASSQSAVEKDARLLKTPNASFDINALIKTNLSCGLPPLPPLGCKNPTCFCDQNGNNCRWIFQCN